MQTYKCKSCGAELEFEPCSNICECSYCGTKNSLSGNDVFIGWNPELLDSNKTAEVEFAMVAENVFSVMGRRTAVVGQVAFGKINVNDRIKIFSDNGGCIECTAVGIEQFRKMLDSAKKGDSIGLILSDVAKPQIKKGDIIIKGELDIKLLNERIASYYVPIGDRAGAVDCYMKTTGIGLREAKIKVDRIFNTY